MGSGLSFESFSAVIGVDRDTLYAWEKKFPKFSDSKRSARAAQLLFYERLGIKQAENSSKDFNSTAFVWMTKNMLGWRDRQDIEIAGPDQGPIQLESLSGGQTRHDLVVRILERSTLLKDPELQDVLKRKLLIDPSDKSK